VQCQRCHKKDFIGYINTNHQTICERCYGIDDSYRWVKIMSNFDKAIKVIFKHEGVYSEDHAGATKYGITLRSLDVDIDHDGDIDMDDIREMTKEDAILFYKRRWWDQYNYDKINNDKVATKLFDIAVNMGQQQASLLIQRALRACDRLGIAEDGKLGSKSFKAINTTESERLIPALRSEAAGFYRLIVAKNSDYKTFLNGWLNRAYS